MGGRITHILVPTDFSPPSDAALAYARDLAQQYAARMSLLHVVTDPRVSGPLDTRVHVPADAATQESLLREARAHLEGALPADERSRFAVTIDARIGEVAHTILETAREQGTRARSDSAPRHPTMPYDIVSSPAPLAAAPSTRHRVTSEEV